MRVVICDELFAPPASSADLTELLRLGAVGPHLIETDPQTEIVPGVGLLLPASLKTWLDAQDQYLRDTAELALSEGIRRLSERQPYWSIRVAKSAQSDWGGVVPVLTSGDALQMLHQPLRLLLE